MYYMLLFLYTSAITQSFLGSSHLVSLSYPFPPENENISIREILPTRNVEGETNYLKNALALTDNIIFPKYSL